LVSSSPSKVGQFGLMLPFVPEIDSKIHLLPCFGRLVCCSTPSLSLYAFPDICWVLMAPLGGWLVGPAPFSAFAALWHITESSVLTAQQWEIGSLPLPHSPGWVQCSTPTSGVGVRLQFAVYGCQFCWFIFVGGGFSGGGGGVGELHVVHDAHLFLSLNCLFIYSYVHTLFGPSLPAVPHLASRQNWFCPLVQFCWRENIRDYKKDIAFLIA
jgi:hypothetical protein